MQKGSTWGGLQAPRANRYIIVRDLTNGALTPLEEFHQSAKKFSPQLIIIAGLHLLEGQPPAKRSARLHDVVSALRASPPVPLHFELASVGSNSFLSSVRLRSNYVTSVLTFAPATQYRAARV